jgi:hypothetical protein
MNKEKIIQNFKSLMEEFMKTHKNPVLSGYKHSSYSSYKSEPDLNNFKGFVSEEWAIGGKWGGNPWNDDELKEMSPDDPKDIDLLDEFLEFCMPNITFLQYKKLTKRIKHQQWSDNEYYGNYTDYKCAYISFDDVADCLADFLPNRLEI